jgi:thiol-disulfide isomerase/thioredoxin
VPAFHLAALDDTSVTYTPASLAGKVYLLDFWATWCGPCVGEMKYLQAAHDSLASRGLEILSVSLDRTPADVRRFRTGAWKMPWLQAYVSGASGDPQMRDLEITILPRTMLIGRDGKILAVDEELRGDALLPTLRHALEGQEGR